jgi:polyisoprenoid-binding protein YceI
VSAVVRYLIDPRASRFTARAFAGGPLSAMGHNPSFAVRDIAGEAVLDPEAADSGSVTVTIKAASLSLNDQVSDKDRREIERALHDDVLESARYPEITYASPPPKTSITRSGDGQFQVTLNGDLTLHGVTRSHPVTARVFVTGDMIRGSAETTLRQSDFGIRLVSVAGGMMKVKEDIKLTFDLVARKQD